MTNPIVLIIGTRPEGIKMIPLYFALKKLQIPIIICSTTQHSDLLDEVYTLFQVCPDYELDIMKPNQDLFHITTDALQKAKDLFNKINPHLVLVQGDTTSSMATALAAFYLNIPVGHVEAGLRTNDVRNPFPEELNRRFISLIATYHFAPTKLAISNLCSEGINPHTIHYTGNTVVDALRIIQEKINAQELHVDPSLAEKVNDALATGKQIVLLTVHRRESFNGGIQRILEAIKEFAEKNPHVVFFYPVHPNPNVLEAVAQTNIANLGNIHLCKPLLYKDIVYLLSHTHWIATDSGGIQEEAISLGKQVLILREKTERIEGIWAGLATLVGTDKQTIIENMEKLSTSSIISTTKTAVYGDGYAANKIASIIEAKRKNQETAINFSSGKQFEKSLQ